MALEATHIRFALDLKDVYGVRDTDAYVVGSIYPDSRYVTGIDRLATHPGEYLSDPMFKTSDFKKGWHAHLLCDTVQGELMKTLLPTVKTGPGEESWIERTAIKILQDFDDAKKFDIAQYLPCLAHMENPNGESTEKMQEYAAIFPVMYADPNNLTIQHAYDMWEKFGINEELLIKVRVQAEQFAAAPSIMEGVLKLYDAMHAKAQALLKE